MSTQRLYYDNCYLKEFTATVISVESNGAIELDRTAFYPESGGQTFDTGFLDGHAVERVEDEGERVLHFADYRPTPGASVVGTIDWDRRFDLMQHHSGQHLLSAVLEGLWGWKTVSVHMSAESATVELEEPEIDVGSLREAEVDANRRIQANLPIEIRTYASAEGLSLRKQSSREGPLRVVQIGELDTSACGGTHVRSTGEIGYLSIGKTERIRKNTRVEFACGMRAVRLARLRAEWLTSAAGVFQTSPDRVASLALAQREEFLALTKRYRDLAMQAARRDGENARASLGFSGETSIWAMRTVPDPIDDVARAFAAAFCQTFPSQPNRGVLLSLVPATGAFHLCAASDSDFDARSWLSTVAADLKIKGGGNASMVSGKVADPEDLSRLCRSLPGSPIALDSINRGRDGQ